MTEIELQNESPFQCTHCTQREAILSLVQVHVALTEVSICTMRNPAFFAEEDEAIFR